jgi:hypothetical protein
MLRKSSLSDFGGTGQTVLIEMRLENYAVIDNLAVEFGQGLNLLTGETGRGSRFWWMRWRCCWARRHRVM